MQNRRSMQTAGPRGPAQRTHSRNRRPAAAGRSRALALRRRASAASAPGLCTFCDQPFEFAVDFRNSIRGARFEIRVRCASGYDGARGVIFAPLRFRFELANVLHETLPLVDIEKYSNEIAPSSNTQAMVGPKSSGNGFFRPEFRQRNFGFERKLIEGVHCTRHATLLSVKDRKST